VSGETLAETRVVIERELPHPPEKVWRALTQPHLIAEWLAQTDFQAVLGSRFSVQINPQPGRVFVFDCEVVVLEANCTLAYTWNAEGDEEGTGLRSTVTWRLIATPGGTRLRMEQAGFDADQPLYYHGARMGWPQFIDQLARLLVRD